MSENPQTISALEAEVARLTERLSRNKTGALLGFACAILIIPLFFLGMHLGERKATRYLPIEQTRPMTHGEDVYIRLARMGFVDWTMACTYAIARDKRSWSEAKEKCSSDYLDRIRDLKPGEGAPSPAEFAKETKTLVSKDEALDRRTNQVIDKVRTDLENAQGAAR